MNQRILKIAEMIDRGMIVADIGTDHALLPIYLIKNDICQKVYACDVAQGPLNSANENIRKFGINDSIITILSNGFENVSKDVECAVIAGMGFFTAEMIIEEGMSLVSNLKSLIVQVNGGGPQMRGYISEKNWTILDENPVFDKGIWYEIIKFNTQYHEAYSEEEIECGTWMITKDRDVYISLINSRLKEINTLLSYKKSEEELERLSLQKKYWETRLTSVIE